jgi:hypothetical protein
LALQAGNFGASSPAPLLCPGVFLGEQHCDGRLCFDFTPCLAFESSALAHDFQWTWQQIVQLAKLFLNFSSIRETHWQLFYPEGVWTLYQTGIRHACYRAGEGEELKMPRYERGERFFKMVFASLSEAYGGLRAAVILSVMSEMDALELMNKKFESDV